MIAHNMRKYVLLMSLSFLTSNHSFNH